MSVSEQVLEHYGVKGQKWGVRRSVKQLASAAGRANQKSKQRTADIKGARKQAAKKEVAVYKSAAKTILSKDNRSRIENGKKTVEAFKDFRTNAATAVKMTRGEKVVNGAILAGAGALIVAGARS